MGVEAEGTDGTKYTIRSRAVLLATGGFGYAKDLLTGNLKQSLYYGPVSSTGDGHKMAKAVGAKLQMMDLGKIYPVSPNQLSGRTKMPLKKVLVF